MENPILKDDLKFHWHIDPWFGKLAWFIVITDKTHIWRRSGICDDENDGKDKIKDCIKNFKKVYKNG